MHTELIQLGAVIVRVIIFHSALLVAALQDFTLKTVLSESYMA